MAESDNKKSILKKIWHGEINFIPFLVLSALFIFLFCNFESFFGLKSSWPEVVSLGIKGVVFIVLILAITKITASLKE